MAFESNRQSPAGDRSGLGIRDNHKSRRAAESDGEFTNDSEGDENAQRGGVERSEPCTKFDRATHESQRYKQKTEALKKQNANLGDASRIPSAENAAMHHGIHSLRAADDQIAEEKKEVANLQKERLPASRGQSWISNWNFLSGTRESVKAEENAEENAIAEAHKKIERREQKIRALEDENRNMQQKMSEQADRMTKHHEHRIGSLDDKNRKLQQKSERVDRMAQHYEQRIGSLEEKNHKLQHTVSEQKDHIHQQTLGFVEELEALKSKAFIDAPRLSDTEVQTRWRALGFAVRQFVSVHLPESLDPSTVQQLAYMDTFSWLPGMMEALRAPIFCSAFLESWMWHFLWRCIFDSHSKLWAGEAGSLWGTLRDVVQGQLHDSGSSSHSAAIFAEFHDWRVRSTHFITDLKPERRDQGENIGQLVAKLLLDELQPIVASIKGPGGISAEMHREGLEIAYKAAELAEFFRLARADYHVLMTRLKLPLVRPPSFGFKFDPETMERFRNLPAFEPGNSAHIVNLVVSPGLLKAGSSDGSNYHFQRVLVKLQVICDLTRTWDSLQN